jgi:hypothetical protein
MLGRTAPSALIKWVRSLMSWVWVLVTLPLTFTRFITKTWKWVRSTKWHQGGNALVAAGVYYGTGFLASALGSQIGFMLALAGGGAFLLYAAVKDK